MKKHLMKPDREFIERSLNSGNSLRKIATKLNKAPSTISREIRSHRHVATLKSYARLC